MIVINKYRNPKVWANEYAMTLDGVSERIITGSDVLDITGAFSISAWIKPDTGGDYHTIICKDTTGGAMRGWNLVYRGTAYFNEIWFYVWNTDGTQNVVSTTTAGTLTNGSYHNIVATYTGDATTNGQKVWVNNSLNAQGTTGSTGVRNYTGGNSGVCIGSTSDSVSGGFFFDGKIDEVAVKNGTVWGSAEIAIISAGGDISALSPDIYCRMGDGATFGGTNWTLPDYLGGAATFESRNMDLTNLSTDHA